MSPRGAFAESKGEIHYCSIERENYVTVLSRLKLFLKPKPVGFIPPQIHQSEFCTLAVPGASRSSLRH